MGLTFTWCLMIMAVWAVYLVRLFIASRHDCLQKEWLKLEDGVSLLQTLGVLGTFVGIVAGLRNFNTNDLDMSIPLLLEGLKTAFYTSITGMGTALVLNFILVKIDKSTKSSDLDNLKDSLVAKLEDIRSSFNGDDSNLKPLEEKLSALVASLSQVRDDVEETRAINDEIREMISSMRQDNSDHHDYFVHVVEFLSRMESEVNVLSEVIANGNANTTSLEETVFGIKDMIK